MQLLTLKAAARLLNVHETIAKRLLASYGVPCGSRIRFPLSAVERVAERGGQFKSTAQPATSTRREAASL